MLSMWQIYNLETLTDGGKCRNITYGCNKCNYISKNVLTEIKMSVLDKKGIGHNNFHSFKKNTGSGWIGSLIDKLNDRN